MPHPILTVAQMRAWEQATWAAGVREEDVMRRAGRAVAGAASRLTREGGCVLFLVGKGHNGDDAAFAHEYLEGREKELLRISEPEAAFQPLAQQLARRPALIVDGLFGIGLNRPLSSAWTKLIDQINAAARPVLAVDAPSGLDADTGEAQGAAVRAAHTITFGGVKQGLLRSEAATFVGRLEVAADIGLVPCPVQTEFTAMAGEDFREFPPPRPVDGHKGTFGHLAILAGSRGFHGAAVLAARGAQRAQPGLITLAVPELIYTPVAAQLQAVMVQPFSEAPRVPEGATAFLAGPGLAADEAMATCREFVRAQWQRAALPVIADASALDWLPAGEIESAAPRVITPHPGEAARMLGVTTGEVQADRPAALRALSQKFGGCQVVLKGHQTLVGRAGGEIVVSLAGNPHLAQGGSGDLLAGYIGGLLAQPALQADARTALRFAVWQHAASADALLATKPNFAMEELATVLGGATA